MDHEAVEAWKTGPPVLGILSLITSPGGFDDTLTTACNTNINNADVNVGSIRSQWGQRFS